MGNKEQFLKIFEQINQKEQNMKEEALKFQKKKSMKKKPSEVKQNKGQHQEPAKKQQILKKIDPLLKRYKNLHCPSFCDSEVAKLRFEGK